MSSTKTAQVKYPDQTLMVTFQAKQALMDAAICCIGFAAFAYLIIYPLPIKAAAFIPLLLVAFIMSRNINCNHISFTPILKNISTPKMLPFNFIGMQIGFAGALFYRGSYGMPLLPGEIRSFVIVAISIALIEELVFRGFIQGRLSKFYPVFAIIFAAFAHALYKASLFLSPAANYHQSVMLFFTCTFGASLLIGVLRFYSKSIIPAILAHVVFDIFVYGESSQPPWWVW